MHIGLARDPSRRCSQRRWRRRSARRASARRPRRGAERADGCNSAAVSTSQPMHAISTPIDGEQHASTDAQSCNATEAPGALASESSAS